MKYVFLLLVLLLAGCAGAQQLLSSASAGEVMPAEALRVLDRASATAAIVATEAAQALGTHQAGIASATAAAQQTRDGLIVEQTLVALRLTGDAGASMSTEMASIKTQAAAQTAAWATPTAAALHTQAAIAAQDQRRRLANAESAAAFWRELRAALVETVRLVAAAGVALGLTWCLARLVVVAVDRVTQIQIDRMRQRAAIAREAFRIVSPGHWAEWQPAEGYQVYPLPNSTVDVPPSTEPAEASPSRAHAWRQAVRLFTWWGDRYGFGLHELGPRGAGVVTDPAWRRLTRLLKAAGVLADLAIDGQKGRRTAWADGWGYRRLADELGSGRLALPFPVDERPPDVAGTVPTRHQC